MNLESPGIGLEGFPLTYSRIAAELRQRIHRGELEPGTKLPSTAALARQWNTHVPIVHRALSLLVREGLLVRRPRLGTFVRAAAVPLTRAALYVPKVLLSDPAARFSRAVLDHLDDCLSEAKVGGEIWVDSRAADEQDRLWEALERAAARRDVQCVISLAADPIRLRWLRKLPVPVSYLGGGLPSAVGFDMRQFLERAIGALSEQGCRSVGLIAPFESSYVAFFDDFTSLCRERGMEFRNEWVRVSDPSQTAATQDQFGYDQFRCVWQPPRRPQGLIVYPDSAARGVIVALLERRVAVPAELRLVLHRNEGIELLCPLAATFIESSCRAVAEALWEQARRQHEGRECRPVLLPFRMVSP